MIYPANFEQKIEFIKVRNLVSSKCLSTLGKDKCQEILFSNSFEIVSRKLFETEEFTKILNDGEDFPFDNFFDVRSLLRRVRIDGSWIEQSTLFDLRRSLQTIFKIVSFFKRDNDEGENRYPYLLSLTHEVVLFPHLIKRIDQILNNFGEVKDSATPELAQIRQSLTHTVGSISKSLQSILRRAQTEGLVDKDASPTMRDGRLVIPVSQSLKRKVRGIIHDESASGKTVFIEPSEVVEANNRVRELEREERREIVRILTEITEEIRPMLPDILTSFDFLAEIDFIQAKAKFAIEINAIKPIVNDSTIVDWGQACHPLLYLSLKKQNRKIVPLDIKLEGESRLLIISGPNAGGKSVCLKTVGLLQYMLQSGLLIPVHESSQAGVFNDIFIDIGDEQSIENDLSTYSSHLVNMKFFIKNCNPKSILLIDEFGSGTEPQIGAAIAESCLERFNNNGAYGVITTHYQNLKHFANENLGVVNGAMLYDRHEMRPLFTLSIGNPGSSFAVEIARKIGLPEDVISDASEKVGSEYISTDKYLQDIVRDKRYWQKKRENIRRKEKQLEDLTEKYDTNVSEIEKERKRIISEAKLEAKHLLQECNARIENTIKEIKEAQAEKEKTKLIRKSLDDMRNEVDIQDAKPLTHLKKGPVAKKTKSTNESNPISAGDYVKIKGQNAIGEVLEINGKKALIALGMIKSSIEISKLEKAKKSSIKQSIQKTTFVSDNTSDAMREKKLNFKQDIDVRGMRGDEALQAVIYFIDDAIQVGSSRVRILHGTGTGALRQIIRDYLGSMPAISNFADEHVQFGGAGITVVEF